MMQLVGILLGSAASIYFLILFSTALLRAKRSQEKHRLSCKILLSQLQTAAVIKKQHEQDAKSWNGYRRFVVNRKEAVAESVCSFELKPHDDRPLPLFKPGQFLTFLLDVPGQPKPVIRCYSISNAPNSNAYEVTIKHVSGGLASGYFHEQVQLGTLLNVQAPRGNFCINPSLQKPLVLIAGGVGLTPFLSMFRAIDQSGIEREVILFYAVHNEAQHILKNELNEIVARNSNLTLFTGYSSPTPNCVVRDCQFSGHLTIDFVKSVLPANNYDYYLCGPSPMMESLQYGLKEWGVPQQAIFTEAFGTSSISSTNTASMTSVDRSNGEVTIEKSVARVEKIRVNLVKSNKESEWSHEVEDLLAFIESNGIEIDSGCRAGNCGSCEVAIRSGTVRYLKSPGFPCPDGTCLPCIAIPVGDIELDV